MEIIGFPTYVPKLRPKLGSTTTATHPSMPYAPTMDLYSNANMNNQQLLGSTTTATHPSMPSYVQEDQGSLGHHCYAPPSTVADSIGAIIQVVEKIYKDFFQGYSAFGVKRAMTNDLPAATKDYLLSLYFCMDHAREMLKPQEGRSAI